VWERGRELIEGHQERSTHMQIEPNRPKRRWTKLAAGVVRWITPTAIKVLIEFLLDLDD